MDCFSKLEQRSLCGCSQNTLFGQNIDSSLTHAQFLAEMCQWDTNSKLPRVKFGSIDGRYHTTVQIDLRKRGNSFPEAQDEKSSIRKL